MPTLCLHRAYLWHWGHVDSWLNHLKQRLNIISWNVEGRMIFKDDVTENSIMIDLLTWMIKLRSSNTNHISPFVSLVFAKTIAECNVALKWIKNKDMMTTVKMVKEPDKELMQDTPITSRKLLENRKMEQNQRNLNPIKDLGKSKGNHFHRDVEEWGGENF